MKNIIQSPTKSAKNEPVGIGGSFNHYHATSCFYTDIRLTTVFFVSNFSKEKSTHDSSQMDYNTYDLEKILLCANVSDSFHHTVVNLLLFSQPALSVIT